MSEQAFNYASIVLAGLAVAGLVGGFLIARLLSGGKGWAGWLLWLALPIVVFAVLFGTAVDPTLSPEQASYNFWLGMVLYSIMIMVPWLPASLVGALIGRRLRKSRGSAATSPVPSATSAPPPEPVADDGLPRWDKADSPRLKEGELQARMTELAIRGGIDPTGLPLFGRSAPDGNFVLLDKFDYLYFGRENGEITFDHATVIADHLFYLVLKDRARTLAARRLDGAPEHDYAARLAAGQRDILAAIDPRWGAQFVFEQQQVEP